MKFRRDLGLPTAFDSGASYDISQSSKLAILATRIASNVFSVKEGTQQITMGPGRLGCDEIQKPLTSDIASSATGLLEFMSLFTSNRKPTRRKRNRLSNEDSPGLGNATPDYDMSIAPILRHPSLSELAACPIMEQHFNQQHNNRSMLTHHAAKGVPSLIDTSLVSTTSDDGSTTYVCGGLITSEIPGSTGRMLGTALARIAQGPEQLQCSIHGFESFLPTLSYCNLSLRGFRPDNLVLDTSPDP